jgi:DNA-binding GntR family transcriptional regulator
VSAVRGPIDAQSVTARVYADLRDRILAGELAPEARIHQESISAELGVSRTPVREALGRLASDGLVELLPNRGARVADVSPADMEASYTARLAIEPTAARLAAEARGREAIASMRAAIADHRRSTGDARAAFAGNRAFHLALLRGSGNQFLQRFGESLWVSRLGMTIYQQQQESSELIALDADEHEEILEAVEAGDGDLAEERCRAHIARARELLFEALRRSASSTDRPPAA